MKYSNNLLCKNSNLARDLKRKGFPQKIAAPTVEVAVGSEMNREARGPLHRISLYKRSLKPTAWKGWPPFLARPPALPKP